MNSEQPSIYKFEPFSLERDYLGRLLPDNENNTEGDILLKKKEIKKLPSSYQFNKRWSVNKNPRVSLSGIYEGRQVRHSVDPQHDIVPSFEETGLMKNLYTDNYIVKNLPSQKRTTACLSLLSEGTKVRLYYDFRVLVIRKETAQFTTQIEIPSTFQISL